MTNPKEILALAIQTMRPNEKILLDAMDQRHEQLVHEEYLNSNGENVFYISNSTGDGEYYFLNRPIRRAILTYIRPNTFFYILSIVKVHPNGSTTSLYNHRDNNNNRTVIPKPRRTRQ